VKIGFLVQYNDAELGILTKIGMKSCQLIVPTHSPLNPARASDDDIKSAVDWFAEHDIEVSSIGDYRNNLDPDPKRRAESIEYISSLLDLAAKMGVDNVCTFAGRDPAKSIADNIPMYKETWAPVAKKAEDLGLKIGFENCPNFQGWPFRGSNIAYLPEAWDLMFDAIPSKALGIEYDPSHLICLLIDPVLVIKRYGDRIVHVHAKDAEVDWDYVRLNGIMGRQSARHRSPGMGDANWAKIISALEECGYKGNIDIEGYHDPIYREEREVEGAIISFKHLLNVIGEQS